MSYFRAADLAYCSMHRNHETRNLADWMYSVNAHCSRGCEVPVDMYEQRHFSIQGLLKVTR